MNQYVALPFLFIRFWFFDVPSATLRFFSYINSSFLRLFSLPILVKTYFKPWKNEYREGLVGFSVGMGIFIKSFVIAADISIFLSLLIIELFILAITVFLPIGIVFLLFI